MIRSIVGLNGAGTSQYLRRRVGEEERHKVTVGYLPDIPTLPVEMSALELFTRVGAMRGVPNPAPRARELLDFLLIGSSSAAPIASYSVGNVHRVALALTLFLPAQVLLLDHPLELVDPLSRLRVWDEFERLADSGVQIEFSTHDLAAAMQCSEVAVMADGEIVAEGPPRVVLGRDPLGRLAALSGIGPRSS
ncbi:MAG: ABC transporter ATP-binding protein [Corynebacterium sp.]|nr:ABC transporter ATP-binding protein [Corynebacterium sp.]